MIDYAKESTTELYNIFCEFDDILEMSYVALEDVSGGETAPATSPATTSATTTPATSPASNAQKSDNENPTTDNDAKKDQGKPVTPSNLRSSSGLSKKLTELMNKLSTVVKEAIEKVLDKIAEIQKDNVNEFLKSVAAAKDKGVQEIEIENNVYKPDIIIASTKMLGNICTEYNNSANNVVTKYEQASAGTISEDELKKEIDAINGKYGAGGIYAYTAKQLRLSTVEGATAKTINTEFQSKVRGEKTKFKITFQYADSCERFLRRAVDTARALSAAASQIKSNVKALDSKVKTVTAKPGTKENLNSQLTSFTTEVSKFNTFVAMFNTIASSLTRECIANFKIVLSRAYNISEKGTGDIEKNTEPDKEAKEDEES